MFQPEKLAQSDELAQLLQLEPDLIVTAAFGQLLPDQLLQLPKLGAINVHPKYRGGAPIHQAIIDGEAQTGTSSCIWLKVRCRKYYFTESY